MVTRPLVTCAALLAVVVLITACGRKPPTPSPLAIADGALFGKDIVDVFDQPTHEDVPLLCTVLSADPGTVGIVGRDLEADPREISDRTKRSPFAFPFLIDDALEDAQHAQCHWSRLTTPQGFKISVEVTAYQKTPATRYARAAFAKMIEDRTQEKLAYERVALGSAACIAGSGQTYYGALRKENVLMEVVISTTTPVPVKWKETVSSSPAYAVLSVLDERFGERGQGAPEQSPDEHDDCF